MKFVFLATLLFVYTYTLQGERITGYVSTDENEKSVFGHLCPEMGGTYFIGNWTPNGTIEAVDLDGKIYLFNVKNNDQYSC